MVASTPASGSAPPEQTYSQARPPIWRNAAIIKWATQIGVLVALLILGVLLWSQGSSNLASKGINVSTKFLGESPGIQVAEGISIQPETGARALYVGIVNTFRVAIAGIIAATVIGTLVGIARLSNNWIVNKASTIYVETLRNIPLLVQILVYSVLITSYVSLTPETGPFPNWLYVSNKGISFAWIFPSVGFYEWMVFIVLGLIAARFVHKWRSSVQENTGQPGYAVLAAVGTVLLFALVGWFLHPIFGWVGGIFGAIASAIDAIPTPVLQIVLAVAAIGGAAYWIKRFLDGFRTPAGMAKLTDDDWFRVVFAGVIGLAAVALLFLRPGVPDFMLNASRDFFQVAEAKFGNSPTEGSLHTADRPLQFRQPAINEGRFLQYSNTGMTMTPGFAALFFGVTLYTGAFIAEIVRGGILAVAKGQSEAAAAVGLSRAQALRLIVLPQAFRIILPPMGNQYLNLSKNTSLGIAVQYPDIVAVGQTLQNQTGQPLPVFLIWMAFYLAVSLGISVIVNYFNRRLKIVER